MEFTKTLQGNLARLFLCSNGQRYVIKFKNDRHGTRELVNEYVANKLAQLLFLPVVPYQSMYIEKNLIQEINGKLKNQFEPGNQYASLYIDHCTGLPQPLPTIEKIKNPEILAGMIVFDHWIDNICRDHKNILFESISKGSYYVHMIDHGSCFPGGYYWTVKKLKHHRQEVFDTVVYRWAFPFLKNEELTSFTQRIKDLQDQEIYNVVQSIPEDWNVLEEEKEYLITFLVKQKNVLPDIISLFICEQSKRT